MKNHRFSIATKVLAALSVLLVLSAAGCGSKTTTAPVSKAPFTGTFAGY